MSLVSAAMFSLFLSASAPAGSAETPPDSGPPFEYMVTKISVSDLNGSLQFYETFFGYREVLRTPVSPAGVIQVYTTRGGENFRHGLTFVHQQAASTPLERGALHTLVFAVRDIENLIRRIDEAGHQVTRRPFETFAYPTPVTGSAVIAYVLDPNGHQVEIVEWRPPRQE